MTDSEITTVVVNALDSALFSHTPIAPITSQYPQLDVAAAYKIQTRWNQLRVLQGDEIIGRKIGLTNPAIQQQLGVSEPDYGALWRSSFYEAAHGRVEIPASHFLQPRVEGEIAFLIKDQLKGGTVTAEDVLAATQACALAVEIVDSRIADWKIKLVDTIADNASYGGFAIGRWDGAMTSQNLAELAMQVRHNGVVAATGEGRAVLGNPANSAAWLVNKLAEFGVVLRPGDIVLSGAISKMIPVSAGDEFVFSLTGQPDLTVTFR